MGGSAYNAKNFGDVLGAWSRKNGHVPGTFRSWYLRGSVSDPHWRQLSLADKTYYEIGQKTLAGGRFKQLAGAGFAGVRLGFRFSSGSVRWQRRRRKATRPGLIEQEETEITEMAPLRCLCLLLFE